MPHVGRIPSTLEKYRHALSAYLEDVTQLNSKSPHFLYFGDEEKKSHHNHNTHSFGDESNSNTPIPDTESRINASYTTVKKQLDLLSSYFSLIHDDLHGDLLLLRTNLNLLPSNTLHIAQRNNQNTNTNNASAAVLASSSLHLNADSQSEDDDDDESKSNYDSNASTTPPTSSTISSDVDEFNLDNILNTKQTQSIQYIVSILQKFIKYNAILVEYIQQNKAKISSFWVQNNVLNHPQAHKLNLDVESIVSTMSVKDLIQTKNYSCHNILFHDILGCANTKQFFTRIYFIVSIWYSFFHSLHLDEYHEDDSEHASDLDDEQETHSKIKPCNTYLTKLFAMTDFSFLTKSSSSPSSGSSSSASSSSSSTSSPSSPRSSSTSDITASGHNNDLDTENNVNTNNSSTNIRKPKSKRRRTRASTATPMAITATANLAVDDNVTGSDVNDTILQRQHSGDSASNWSSNASSNDEECDVELSLSGDSTNSKNDFLLKYLNAQNNYLQSIWNDGIALLEYSLHLLQQQEFRLSCRVAHRCLELFQKQQLEQQRLRHQRRQSENWNDLNHDLYPDSLGNDEQNLFGAHNHGQAGGDGVFMVDPITNQPAQIPGLWYIEMHLANCYHTWGQSNMALFHINRTLEQLGNYQINPDTLTVRLNSRRKFKLLSTYLVQSTQRTLALRSKQQKAIRLSGSDAVRSSPRKRLKGASKANEEFPRSLQSRNSGNNKHINQEMEAKENDVSMNDAESSNTEKKRTRRRSFMKKIKINNRRKRKSNVFSKLFDRFSGSKKKDRKKQQQENRQMYNMDDSKSSERVMDSPLNEWNTDAAFQHHAHSRSGSANTLNSPRSGHSHEHERSHTETPPIHILSADEEEEDVQQGAEEEQKEIVDPDLLQLELCLEEDLNLEHNIGLKLAEDTENEMELDEVVDPDLLNNEDDEDEEAEDDEDAQLEVEFFHNDPDAGADNDGLEEAAIEFGFNAEDENGAQMITLEALLSMHMTKGRILIEMKLLQEALDLYTYVIDECEALIEYHSLINPHHIQLESEYDRIDEIEFEHEQKLQQFSPPIDGSNHRRRRQRHQVAEGNEEEEAKQPHNEHTSSGRRHRRRRNRRRHRAESQSAVNGQDDEEFGQMLSEDDEDYQHRFHGHRHHHGHHHMHRHHRGPPPNTPFRRLAKNIGLENYYAARGDIYFKFKDLKNALKDFSNAIKYGKCKKEMGIYYNLRGVCYHEMKQYERALRDYDNAVKSMYGNHVAWNNRAALLVDMQQYDDAIENANNAIKLDPSYGNAYKHRGVAYHLKNEFEKAITDINRCIKLLPNYRPARLALLAIWKDIFEGVRVVNIDEGVPLDLVKIMVDYTVGNGYEIDECMVNFTYC